MSGRADRTVVQLAGFAPKEEFTRALRAQLSGTNIELRLSPTSAAAAETVESAIASGATAPAVVLLHGPGAVAAARDIRTAAPATQLVFLADWRERSELQPELRAANLGHGWSFALPDPALLVATIRDAAATSGQRRLVRTTLDRRDVRVSAGQLDAQRVRNLAISDALLGAILRDAVDAIIATDQRGRIVSANPSASRLFGRSETEVAGTDIAEIIPGAADLASLAGQVSSQAGRCHDGSEVPVDLTVSRVVVGASPAGYAIIARDARERLAAEAELRRQAELTSTIVNGIAEGVYVIDAFGNLLFMNPAAEDLLGWKRDDLASHNIHDTIHSRNASGEHVTAADCPLLQAIRTGISVRTEDVFVRKDGTLVPVDCAVTPVRMAGEVIGGVFSFHDLTQYRAIQAQLTAEKDSLLQLNRAKDDFIATVSHELRTPLTAILGWLQIVSGNDVERGEMNEALEAIETSARAQAQIVNDLLDVSRVISGKLHLNMAEVDVNDIVSAAAATLRPNAEAKKVEVVVQPEREPMIVCGDSARLHQVVWNLLSNAVKFTPERGRVTMSVHAADDRVRIVVSDTGAGIPPEELPTIFERYRQAAGSTAKGGLGLGLAIVRTLVERHSGQVSIASELDRGTTVTIELPRRIAGVTSAVCG